MQKKCGKIGAQRSQTFQLEYAKHEIREADIRMWVPCWSFRFRYPLQEKNKPDKTAHKLNWHKLTIINLLEISQPKSINQSMDWSDRQPGKQELIKSINQSLSKQADKNTPINQSINQSMVGKSVMTHNEAIRL